MAEKNKPGSLRRLLTHAVLLSARCCFAAATLFLCFWLLFAGPLKWRIDREYNTTPEAKAIYSSELLGGMLLRDLIFLWLSPAILAVSATVVLLFQPLIRQQLGTSEAPLPGQKWTSRLLAPRGFWQWLCGGLTVLDLFVILVWAAINASWLSALIAANYQRALLKQAARAAAAAPAGPVVLTATQQSIMVAKTVAKSFGSLMAPNLVLLFYPISRGSVVLQLLRMPYAAAIRYHRWLGYACLTLVAIHGITYHAVWIRSNEWVAEALETGRSHNNLLGSVAFLFGLALWLTSLDTVRRSNYPVFKTMHHIGFWGFMICACCHKWEVVYNFLPGLMLYAVDGVYRIYQLVLQPASGSTSCSVTCQQAVQVLHATVSPNASLCSIVLSAPQFGVSSSGIVWLCVPEISAIQCHPFDYIAVPWATTGNEQKTAMLVHIKAYNRWTKKLLALLASKGEKISVKIQGPYAEVPGPVLGHPEATLASSNSSCKSKLTQDGVIILAGGNGICAAASVFQELAAAAPTGLPALLVWSSRSSDELEMLAPMVMAMADTLKLQLTTKLFYTGEPSAQELREIAKEAFGRQTVTIPDTTEQSDTAFTDTDSNANRLASAMKDSACVNAMTGEEHHSDVLTTTSLCPVAALGSWWCQAGHKLLMHVVVLGGALCALILAHYITSVIPNKPWPTGPAGAVYVALIVAFTLIPGLATLQITLALQKLQSKQHLQSGVTAMPVSATPNTAIVSSAQSAPAAAAAAVVQAGWKGTLVSSANGLLQLQLPAVHKPIAVPAGKAVQQMSHASFIIPVEIGRPELGQAVKSWLATLQQLAAPDCGNTCSGDKHLPICTVFAMGPTKMVEGVQQLCDDVKGLYFVRKTHQL